jgi:hypothetical protein
MKIYCINFCMVVSWIAVVTLTTFWWIAIKEPILLEIEKGKESKAKETLIFSAIIYLVLALLITAYRGIFMRGETVSEGVSRLKSGLGRGLRAGERHNNFDNRKSSLDSDEP